MKTVFIKISGGIYAIVPFNPDDELELKILIFFCLASKMCLEKPKSAIITVFKLNSLWFSFPFERLKFSEFSQIIFVV